jgi:cytochrome c oxidase cbb3-type subunit 3
LKHFAIGTALLLLTAAVVAWSAPARADQAALQYKIFCAKCHGFTGHGDGPDASTLQVKPRDFADCSVMSKISDDTMFKAIKDGGGAVGLSKEMPAWSAGLSDQNIHDLITYIRTFCK